MTRRPIPRSLTRRAILAGMPIAAAGLALPGAGLRLVAAQDGTPTASPSASPVVASPIASPTTGATPRLRIGLVPSESGETILQSFGPVGEFLQAELEVEEFEVIPGIDYTAVIEAMRGGNLEVGFFGGFSYILANQIAGARSLVMAGDAAGNTSVYYSLIQANADSGITDLEGLRGRSFTFVDPASTSGYLIPSSMLVAAGIDPETDLTATFAGGHDASLLAINGGQAEAGASSNSVFEQMLEEGLIEQENFVLLQQSDPIPSGPFAVSGEMDPGLAERLRQAMLRAHEELGAEVVSAVLDGEGERFVDSPDSLYDPLREVAEVLDLNLEELS